MTEKNEDLTVEKIREQNRIRNKRHYERNKELVKRKARERYHRKKLDKDLSDLQQSSEVC